MKHLKTYTAELHATADAHDYSNHHLLRFFRLWLNGDYCANHEQREQRQYKNDVIIATSGASAVKSYLTNQFIEHLIADGFTFNTDEVRDLFNDERFYSEVKEDFYNLIVV